MSNLVVITDENFEQEVLQSEIPVLIDLWAEWCGPCHMVAPIVEQLAAEYNGKLKVGKLDVDTSPMIPGSYGVQGIPTLLLFKNGQEVGRIVGARPKGQFISMLAPHLG